MQPITRLTTGCAFRSHRHAVSLRSSPQENPPKILPVVSCRSRGWAPASCSGDSRTCAAESCLLLDATVASKSQAPEAGIPAAKEVPPQAGRPHWLDGAASKKRLRGPYSERIVDMATGTANRRKVSTAFAVNKILARRKNLGNEKLEYLVRWKVRYRPGHRPGRSPMLPGPLCARFHRIVARSTARGSRGRRFCAMYQRSFFASRHPTPSVRLKSYPMLMRVQYAPADHAPLTVELPDKAHVHLCQAPVLDLDFCRMRLEVMTDRWTFLDLDTMEKHTRQLRRKCNFRGTATGVAESGKVGGLLAASGRPIGSMY